jgi:hypothetical protein
MSFLCFVKKQCFLGVYMCKVLLQGSMNHVQYNDT